MNSPHLPLVLAGYTDWLADIKSRVSAAQQRAVLAANAELMRLRALPEPLVTSLTTVEELESELGELQEEPQP